MTHSLLFSQFLPRHALLARYTLSSCVCPSVHMSVISRCCIETTGRIELVFDWRLPSTYPTLYCKEIWASPTIRVLLSGTLFQTPDLENFARQVDRVVNKTRRRRRRSSLLTTPIRQSTASRSTVTFQLHCWVLLSICCTICFYS